MIASTDTEDIMYRDCVSYFGLPTYHKNNIPAGEVTEARVTVGAKYQQRSGDWLNNFVEVNISVPDKQGQQDIDVLQEYERMAKAVFKRVSGEYDGDTYRYSWESIGIEEDAQFRCHYVNARIYFEVLNIN